MGENISVSNVSKPVVVSFCVAGMALREIVTCLQTRRKSLCVQGQYFCVVFRRRVALFVAGAALETSIVILRGRCSTLDVSRCVFFANAIVSAVSGGDNVQNPWPAWHVVTCDDTPHSTLHTLHFTLNVVLSNCAFSRMSTS